jgi:hypothetical protein
MRVSKKLDVHTKLDRKEFERLVKEMREEGGFASKLDKDVGVSIVLLCSFAQEVFVGVSPENIGVWPAEGELIVGIIPGDGVARN